ncbi:MAG TPA: alpha/beta hydrolase [bacterium]|nr:alpha/beta hydrolase [bacterium]
MRRRRLKIHGLRQQLYTWGSPKLPPLFFLHGWLDTGAGFEFVARFLAKKFHCIAPDMRGYGQSEHAKSQLGYFFFEYVADLHELFAKLSPKRPVRVLGHSLGGMVASIYAGTFPERVSELINVEGYLSPGRKAEIAPDRARAWIEGFGRQRFRTFKSLEGLAARLQTSNPRLPADRALFLAKHLAKRVRGAWTMAADPNHKLLDPYWLPREAHFAVWARIQARCLLVSAAKTEMALRFGEADFAAEKALLESRFPAGTAKAEIPDCGHMAHHEKPEILARLALDFLEARSS